MWASEKSTLDTVSDIYLHKMLQTTTFSWSGWQQKEIHIGGNGKSPPAGVGLLALECQGQLKKAGGGLGACSSGSCVLLGKLLFFHLWKSFVWFFAIRGLRGSKSKLFNGATEVSSSFPRTLLEKTPCVTDQEDSFCTAKIIKRNNRKNMSHV